MDRAGSRHLFRSAAGNRGLTFLELILVVALAGVVMTLSMPYMAASIGRNQLDLSASRAVDSLREAQFSAMNGRQPGRFGVHFESSKIVTFRGAAYAPGDAGNDEFILTDGVAATAISLSGGGADVHFDDQRGEPVETGSVVLSGPGEKTRTITINAVGMIQTD